MEPMLVGKREAARVLSVSVRTLEHLIAAKQITVRRVGRRVLVPRKELEKFSRRDHITQLSAPRV
jgi:excisionase family DNA binding protein